MDIVLLVLACVCLLGWVVLACASVYYCVTFLVNMIKDAPELEIYKSGCFGFGAILLGSSVLDTASWLLSMV